MANEEFSSKSQEFWYLMGKLLSVLPVIALIGFVVAYFVGSSRENYIKQYNKGVQDWLNGGKEEFDNLFFNMTDSSGIEYFHSVTESDGLYYPVRDTCNLKGDPKDGCLSADVLYYDEDILFMLHDNYFTIYDKDDNVLVDRRLDGFAVHSYTAKEVGCRLAPETCQIRCEAKNGTWDSSLQLCNVTLYADEICYRVVLQDDRWVLDRNNSRNLPLNTAYNIIESDGLGCTYDNNWNSVHYGSQRYSNIRINIRSAKDPYIVASAYTHGCSNQHKIEASCFGLPRYQEKSNILFGIYISLGLVGVVILFICIILIVSKMKFRKAVRESVRETKDALLEATV